MSTAMCPICQSSTAGRKAVLLEPKTRDQFITVRGLSYIPWLCLDCHAAICRFPTLVNDVFAGLERAA